MKRSEVEGVIAVVDVGGTKVNAALVAPYGRFESEVVTLATGASRPTEDVVATIVSAVSMAIAGAGAGERTLAGIGVGCAGPVDARTGVVLNPPNLPSLNGFALAEALAGRFGVPALLDSDGNVFALGEAVFGKGRGHGIVFGVTLGTGFGNGLVIDGRVYQGATGTATEMWCSPYLGGVIDDFVTGRALARFYEDATGTRVEPREVARRARHDADAAARKAWESLGHHVGVALSYVVNLLDPDIVVVGGSLAEQWDLFAPLADATMRANVNPGPRGHVLLEKSELGGKANLLGAAALVRTRRGPGPSSRSRPS